MRKYNPADSEVFVDESGKVQFKYQQQESRLKPHASDWEGRAKISKNARKATASDIKKAMNKVHGLTKKQMATLSTIPVPMLTTFINQLSTLVSDKEAPKKPEITEAPLVMDDMGIIKSILNKIEDDLSKLIVKKQLERGWNKLQILAKMAGYKITKTAQAKGKTYRYDIKK